MDALQDMVEKDRMVFPGIGSPEKTDLCLLRLGVGARTTTRSKYCRQTDDARSVSRPVAAIDVVRSEGNAGELLRQEIHLVR
jgi:hypothetical protein